MRGCTLGLIHVIVHVNSPLRLPALALELLPPLLSCSSKHNVYISTHLSVFHWPAITPGTDT